jgi:hypothetical protein
MSAPRILRRPVRQQGAGMIETMVGILIGLIVVVVVYNMLAVAEGYKRMTTGLADTQVTGLLAHFVVAQDAGNAGNGWASSYTDLINCTRDSNGNPFTAENTLKPISLIISSTGAQVNDSDAFVLRQSSSPHVTWPVPLRPVGGLGGPNIVAPGGDIQVQSPNGFMTPAKASLPTAAKSWWAIMIRNADTGPDVGRCELIEIVNATPDANMDQTGEVLLKQGATKTKIDYSAVTQNATGTPSYLLNLGRDGVDAMRRVRYEVNPPAAVGAQQNQLLQTDCSDPVFGCLAPGATRNPIAQNVVLMKVQYGIDTVVNGDGSTLDGAVTCWTSGGLTAANPNGGTTCPINAGPPANIAIANWAPNTLVQAGELAGIPANTVSRVLAVRVGIVVQSDEPDLRDPSLFAPTSFTIDGKPGTRQPMYLFNCATNTDAGCPNRLLIPAGPGTAVGQANCNAANKVVLCDGFRYVPYEVIIPLRNNIYRATQNIP